MALDYMQRQEAFTLSDVMAILAIAQTPFWFIHPAGINIGPADILFITTAPLIVIKAKQLIAFPDRLVGVGVLLFLAAAVLSLTKTPRPVAGLLDFVQYVLIFVVVVPVTITVCLDSRHRWVAILLLWIGLNGIMLAALTNVPGASLNELRHLSLWFGNQNQLYWLVAAAMITNLGFALDITLSNKYRYIAGGLFLASAVVVFLGQSLSAIIMAITGAWLFMLSYLLNAGKQSRIRLFLAATGLSAVLGIAVVIRYWDFLYYLGNGPKRLYMYGEALRIGTAAFPFGTGLGSSPVVLAHFQERNIATSIHNFLLAYYLELGALGFLGFGLIVVGWLKHVFVSHMQSASLTIMTERIPTMIFAGFLVAMLFQNVIVHRFWWIIFALSWASVISTSDDTDVY